MKKLKNENFILALENIAIHYVTTKCYINIFEKIVTDHETPSKFYVLFKTLAVPLLSTVVMNLSKIVDNRESVNLHKVVETFNGKYNEEKIEVIFDEKALRDLKAARDKFFAHNDKISLDENHGLSLQLEYILSLTNEVERVLNIIYIKEKNIKLFNNEDTSSDKPTNRIIAIYTDIQRVLKQQEEQTNEKR